MYPAAEKTGESYVPPKNGVNIVHRWAVNGFFLDPALCYSSAGRKSTRYLRVLCQRKNRIYKYRFFRSTKEDLQSIACQNQLWGCSIRVLPFQARFDLPPPLLPPIVSILLPLTPFLRTDGTFLYKIRRPFKRASYHFKLNLHLKIRFLLV